MNKIGFVILALGIIVVIGYLYLRTTKSTFYYPDEPKIANARTVSPWTTPKKPEIISVTTGGLDKNLITTIWKEHPDRDLSKALKDLKIDQKYYNYFYNNIEIPYNSEKADLNDDGILDYYFQSFDISCGSCHGHQVAIFINNKVFITEIQGDFKARSDKKGFYTTNEIRNFKTPESDPPDAIEIDRFQWNGSGFTETGIRTIKLGVDKK
ncbi:MAG TPA: hypothetical protein VMR59_03880 [Patescibacteria group bacterium]|nr:hypothetical protein [Patescibacteria group bacterium]